MTPINIASCFRKSGAFPFNRNFFTEGDFLPSSVTDRPIVDKSSPSASQKLNFHSALLYASENVQEPQDFSPEDIFEINLSTVSGFSIASSNACKDVTLSKKILQNPQEFEGFPKWTARKQVKGRKRGKRLILTDIHKN